MRVVMHLTARSLRLGLGLAIASTLVACSSSSGTSANPSTTEVASSSVARDKAPNVTTSDAEALRSGNTALATDLYATLSGAEFAGKNIFFSPHSISMAMAMLYAGANGNTAAQIASALHFTLPQAELHPALNALDLELTKPSAVANEGRGTTLDVVNSSWGEKQMKFQAPFLDTLAKNYGAGVRLTDFIGDPNGSRAAINEWVEDQTNDKIVDLLPDGAIDQKTRLVLVNAMYFKGQWANQFEPSLTKPATFHGRSGDETVPMMAGGGSLNYAEGDGWKAVELDFDASAIGFDIILPDSIDAFETTFGAAKLDAIAGAFEHTPVKLTLPKFKLPGATFSLKSALSARGVVDAFSETAADLTGIAQEKPLFVSDVVHQAFLSVDEDGVEAAAATAVVNAGGSAHVDPPKEVTVDRPFVLVIRQKQSDANAGTVLFLGRVLDVPGPDGD
jgi:serpin B